MAASKGREDAADFAILRLANHKRKFALSVTADLPQEAQEAFERGLDERWYELIDVSPIATPEARFQLMRIFRLTPQGYARLAELSKQAKA